MFRTSPKRRRLEMMMNDYVPTQSEISRRMGPSLAKVFFEYCHQDSKQLLGVIPPLEGPRNELWISPSDQLIGKVALVPPLTNKYIKACTHQGILALGKEAMEKYEKYLYESMVKKYDEESGETRNMFEAEKRRAVQIAEEDLSLKYENYVETLREEFERKLQTALTEAFKNCTKSMQKAVIKERIEVTRMMLKKLRDEIGHVVISLYENFEYSLNAQRENIISDFNEIFRRQSAKTDEKMKEIERQKNEALQIQRNELEMQNFADVTYVLCLERMRSSSEKHAIHLCFEKQIQALKHLLIKANDTLNRSVKPETTEASKITDEKSTEKKLFEVVREFQKFINFALKAVPGQAEFLLCLESILRPETASNEPATGKNLPDKEKLESLQPEIDPQFEIVEIIDSSGEKWIPMQLIPDLPKLYCTKDQLMSPIVKSEIDICSDSDYVIKDKAASKISLNSHGSLPFCYLENVLYVRSDYRENSEYQTKTAAQLAEGSRFIMELKKERKPCDTKIIERITDSISSSSNISKNSKSNVKRNSAKEKLKSSELCTTVFEKLVSSNSSIDISPDNSVQRNVKKNTKSKVSRNIGSDSNISKVSKNSSIGIKKPSEEGFGLIGDDNINHSKIPRDFTCARMRSLTRIFKLHPSLHQILIPKATEVLY